MDLDEIEEACDASDLFRVRVGIIGAVFALVLFTAEDLDFLDVIDFLEDTVVGDVCNLEDDATDLLDLVDCADFGLGPDARADDRAADDRGLTVVWVREGVPRVEPPPVDPARRRLGVVVLAAAGVFLLFGAVNRL